MTFNGTRGNVRDVFMWCPQDGSFPMTFNHGCIMTIENCFFHYFDRLQYDYINAKFNELKVDWGNVLHIKNCFKNMLSPSDVTMLNANGVTIDGNDTFNNNSLSYSIESTIVNDRIISPIKPADRDNPTYNILGAFYTDGNIKWKAMS